VSVISKSLSITSFYQRWSHPSDMNPLFFYTQRDHNPFFCPGKDDHSICLAVEFVKIAVKPPRPSWMMEWSQNKRDITFSCQLERSEANPFPPNSAIVNQVGFIRPG
jgi:hypothetical protein